MADAPRLLTRTGGRSSFLVGVEPTNASVNAGNSSDNPLCKVQTRRGPDRSGLAAKQAGPGSQPASQGTRDEQGQEQAAGNAVRGLHTEPQARAVRLTGRDKPCRQPARAAHPPSFPPFHPQPYHGPRGLRWVRRCMGVGPLLPLSFFGALFFLPYAALVLGSPREQTFGYESLVNPVIKPRTQDSGNLVTSGGNPPSPWPCWCRSKSRRELGTWVAR